MLLLTFCDRLHCVQMLRRPRCNSALEIVGALGPYLGRGAYEGASPRARVRDVRCRAAVSSASCMTAAEASPAPPPIGPECEAVTARRGLSCISAAALDGIGGGGFATQTRGGVAGGVVRNGWAPLAMARTSARVRNEPDGRAGAAAPQNRSQMCTACWQPVAA